MHLCIPVICIANHIAIRQFLEISLREIRKCVAFSAERINPFPTI